MLNCEHRVLSVVPSTQAGYSRPTAEQRAAAATSSGLKKKQPQSESASFPAPLLLPGDDLASDPSYPSQSLRSWLRDKDRNQLTPQRNVIYIAAPPQVESDVSHVRLWTRPTIDIENISSPKVEHVIDYLSAFYHGLPVKLFSSGISFTCWDAKPASKRKQSYIGLKTSTECIRIRARVSPDGIFPQQLNLDDLLDVTISLLPEDAFALLLLVEHDLYEDEEDLFVCGRAYGGSRVAVVSFARYHPSLDSKQGVERYHAWPASHCEEYIRACLATEYSHTKKRKKSNSKGAEVTSADVSSALQDAVSAHCSLPSLVVSPSAETLAGLWLGRACRTASHELGHCFGMDHCVYYACNMQGSSSIAEDARQPPYLCPIDLTKVLRVTGSNTRQRYLAVLSFCDKHKDVHLFSSFGAWIRVRLKEV